MEPQSDCTSIENQWIKIVNVRMVDYDLLCIMLPLSDRKRLVFLVQWRSLFT